MDDKYTDLAVHIQEIDSRSKSNEHRIDELEVDKDYERWDILDRAKKDSNFHFELSMDYFGNEGLFDDNQQYVIYEREDVERLIKRLQEFV